MNQIATQNLVNVLTAICAKKINTIINRLRKFYPELGLPAESFDTVEALRVLDIWIWAETKNRNDVHRRLVGLYGERCRTFCTLLTTTIINSTDRVIEINDETKRQLMLLALIVGEGRYNHVGSLNARPSARCE